MLFRLLFLFILIPFIELTLLIRLGEIIGFWNTVGIIIGTGVLGSYLARREGLSVWMRFQQRLQTAGLPGKELLDGVIILVSGALLLTPGVLTDVVGLLGLLPPTRAVIRNYLKTRIKQSGARASFRFIHVDRSGNASSPFESRSRPTDSSNKPASDHQDISDMVDARVISTEPSEPGSS